MKVYRVLPALVFSALMLPGVASAQSASDWAGWQIGAGVGLNGGRNSDISIEVDSGRAPGFIYPARAPARSFRRERNLERETVLDIRAARLFEFGSLVAGVEIQAQSGGPDLTMDTGPVEFLEPTLTVTDGMGGTLTRSFQTLTTEAAIERQASIRLRAGVPLNDRLLLSGFVGGAWASADFSARQDGSYQGFRLTFPPPGSRPFFSSITLSDSASQSDSDTAFGVTAGAIVDVKLSDRWSLRTEAALTRYQELVFEGPVDGSRFAIKPNLYSASLGLTYRF